MFDSIFLIVFGIPVGLFLLALTIGMIRDMFPERKSVLEKLICQLEKELDETQKALTQKEREKQSAIQQAVESETRDLKDRLSAFTKENTRLNAKLHPLEDKNKRLSAQCERLSNENLALKRKNAELQRQNDGLHDENTGLLWEIKHSMESQEAPSPFPYKIDRTLYQNGVNCGRLKTALSENIIDRFVDIDKTVEIGSIYDAVEIIPEEKSIRTENYQTCLAKCTCEDFVFHTKTPPHACKHMFTLAMQLGILTVAGERLTPPRKTK